MSEPQTTETRQVPPDVLDAGEDAYWAEYELYGTDAAIRAAVKAGCEAGRVAAAREVFAAYEAGEFVDDHTHLTRALDKAAEIVREETDRG